MTPLPPADSIITNFLLGVCISLISSVLGLVVYIGTSYGIHTMSATCGMSDPWLAWIPYARIYQFGALADRCSEKQSGRKSRFRHWLVGLEIATTVLAAAAMVWVFVSFAFDIILWDNQPPESLGEVLTWMFNNLSSALIVFAFALAASIVYTVCHAVALFRIYRAFAPDRAVLYIVLSVLFFPLVALFLFLIAHNRPAFPPADSPDSH